MTALPCKPTRMREALDEDQAASKFTFSIGQDQGLTVVPNV